METQAVTTPQVNTQAPIASQPTISKDTNLVSEANSFQNTLKDLDVTNPVAEIKTPQANGEEVKSEVKNSVQPETTNATKQMLSLPEMIVTNKQSEVKDSAIKNINDIQNVALQMQEKPMKTNVNSDKQEINHVQKQPAISEPQQEIFDAKQKTEIAYDKKVLPLVTDIKPKREVNKEKALQAVKPRPENHVQKQPAISEPQLLEEKMTFSHKERLANPELNTDLLGNEVEKQIGVQNPLIASIEHNQLKEAKNALETLSDLNSKISAINSITTTKTTQTKSSLGSIKVSAEDASFFAKLVENSNNANTVQTNVTVNTNTNQVNLADAKAQAAQQSSAAVSQALIEKLQDSMNTNKSFRVDFDKDVAVIMRVDSNGVLSANFIPGSSAVEQALRNNLAELRQTFNEKGLEYNELSYSSRQQKHQQKQQRNQKGGRDE